MYVNCHLVGVYWEFGPNENFSCLLSTFTANGSSKIENIGSYEVLTYLLTHSMMQSPSEQLTGLQLVKKFPAFHGTPRFFTALTSVHHLSLSCASPIQSIYPHPTSWRSVLILSTHLLLGLPSGLFPSGFSTKTLYIPTVLTHTYLLTHSMVQSPSEQLTGLQIVKKFPAFHGTRRFITTLTSVRHLSLSWASPIQLLQSKHLTFRRYNSNL